MTLKKRSILKCTINKKFKAHDSLQVSCTWRTSRSATKYNQATYRLGPIALTLTEYLKFPSHKLKTRNSWFPIFWLYMAKFEIWAEYLLCFCQKFENSKWPPFFKRQNYFEIWADYLANVPCAWKILTKLLYLTPLRIYKWFRVLPKIQNGRHFWKDKYFF